MGATTTTSKRRARHHRLLLLQLLFCINFLVALQISLVSCSEAASAPNSAGVIIRHGRSRGRHSSERRSQQLQQQHTGDPTGADNNSNFVEHPNLTEFGASKAFIEERNVHSSGGPSSASSAVDTKPPRDNDSTRPIRRLEKTIIRLGAAAENGGGGLLPYHPHPVRFSHKKAIEAKYKILKLTEKGLTNFKWQQSPQQQQQQQAGHRKHVASTQDGGVPANDVARRRSPVASDVTHNGRPEDRLIGGKQLLSPATGSQLLANDDEEKENEEEGDGLWVNAVNDVEHRPEADVDVEEQDARKEANNNRLDIASSAGGDGWNANEQHVERPSPATPEAREDEPEAAEENRSTMARNNSRSLVTHLHSYLFKAIPQKRHPQPQMNRLGPGELRSPDRELLLHSSRSGSGNSNSSSSSENSSTDSPSTSLLGIAVAASEAGAAAVPVVSVDNGESNKSISSGPDRRRLSSTTSPPPPPPQATLDVSDPGDDKSGGDAPGWGSSKSRVIGPESNVARTWQEGDNGSDNTMTGRAAVKNNGQPMGQQSNVTGEEISRRAEVEATGSVVVAIEADGGVQETSADNSNSDNNKGRFNSDNSSPNEGRSNGTRVDGRSNDQGYGALNGRHPSSSSDAGLAADDKSSGRQHHGTQGMKIEEIFPETAVASEIMTTERMWTETLTERTTTIAATTTSAAAAVVVVSGQDEDASDKDVVARKPPEGSHELSNKSESLVTDREMNRGSEWQQKQDVSEGKGNENTRSSGSAWPASGVVVIATGRNPDNGNGGDAGDGLNKLEMEHEEVTRGNETLEWHGAFNKPDADNNDSHEWSEVMDEPPMSSGEQQQADGEVSLNMGFGGGEDTLSTLDEDDDDVAKLDDASRNNRLSAHSGYDKLSRFLQTVEQQHLLGDNCTAGTSLNLGEGVVDRYAQERFRIQAEIAVNRANMLTR